TADDFVFPEDDASEILFQQGVYAYGFMHLQSFLPVHQQIKSDPVEPAEIRKQEKSWRSVGLSFFMQIEGFDTETQPTTIFSAVV
ncbi:MAG: hypothetical protein HN580_24920, partial [Deltaproteobacteria bacterium]|nr:hypothetical protein [Deltaproteobacteria bacterium]